MDSSSHNIITVLYFPYSTLALYGTLCIFDPPMQNVRPRHHVATEIANQSHYSWTSYSYTGSIKFRTLVVKEKLTHRTTAIILSSY